MCKALKCSLADADENLGSAVAVKVLNALTLKADYTIFCGKDRVISPEHNIFANIKLATALANDNHPFFNLLTAKNLNA